MSAPLTERQLTILALARIATKAQTARRLGVSEGTVSMALGAIRRKLNVASTEAAIEVALRRGWIG